MATTTMARTTGRTPLSPPRSRSHQARRYSGRDLARSSGGTSAAAPSGAAVRSTAVLASAFAGLSAESAVTGMSDTGHAPSPTPRQYVDEHCSEQHATRNDVLQRRGQGTQVQKGDSVGDPADEEAAEHTVECLAP